MQDMIPVPRKKYTRKKCRNCRFFNDGWCDIYYSRHDAMTPRCRDRYEPSAPFWTNKWFWLGLLVVILMVIGMIVKLH